MAVTKEEWDREHLPLLRSTKPMNVPRAMAAVRTMYANKGLPPPYIDIVSSPKEMKARFKSGRAFSIAVEAVDAEASVRHDSVTDQLLMLVSQITEVSELETEREGIILRARALLAFGPNYFIHNQDWIDSSAICKEVECALMTRDRAVLCDRPETILIDGSYRLHSLDSAAVRFRDGDAYYFVTGVQVPKEVVEERTKITAENVFEMGNLERRRVLIELMGREKFLAEAAAKKIDESKAGVLWRIDRQGKRIVSQESMGGLGFIISSTADEDLVFVEVENATVENGERRKFFMRVPPNMKTAGEAVAWTFGMSEKDYQLTKAA